MVAGPSVACATVLIVDDFSACPWPGERSVVTIGAYDGLHVGHRTIIDKVVDRARRDGSKSVLVTFDRHPASLVRPESAPKLLTDHEQKIELLRDTGLDAVAVVRFDAEQAAESPQEFVTRVLVRCLGVAHIIVGSDFHFGRGRAGNVELLTTLGVHDPGFTVEPVSLIAGHTGVTASSTEIRRLLTAGQIEDANVMLGRRFELRGVVAHGDARGRTIGFPTANVEVPAWMCVPGDGVYAAWYVRPGHELPLPAAVNIGRRPTFYENAPVSLIEAHVIEPGDTQPGNLDLYGEVAHVRFVARLRGEQKFEGLEALKSQLTLDIATARAALDRAS